MTDEPSIPPALTERGWGGYPELDIWEHIPRDDIWNFTAWDAYMRRVIERARELGFTSLSISALGEPPKPMGTPPGEREARVLPDLLKEAQR